LGCCCGTGLISGWELPQAAGMPQKKKQNKKNLTFTDVDSFTVFENKDSDPPQNENFQCFIFDCSCLQKYSCEYTNVPIEAKYLFNI